MELLLWGASTFQMMSFIEHLMASARFARRQYMTRPVCWRPNLVDIEISGRLVRLGLGRKHSRAATRTKLALNGLHSLGRAKLMTSPVSSGLIAN